MKRWGFLTGALLGAIAVWAFYALTTETDDDRLATVLMDHCVPYVQTGADPFTDLGRAPGVFDNLDLRDSIAGGGARLLYDNRFTAQWGEVTAGARTSRICEISPTPGEPDAAFAVYPDGFIDRYATLLGLTADVVDLGDGPSSVGFYTDPDRPNDGFRVVMIASPGLVANTVVMDDAPAN